MILALLPDARVPMWQAVMRLHGMCIAAHTPQTIGARLSRTCHMPASSNDAYTVRTSDIIILQAPESDEPPCLG